MISIRAQILVTVLAGSSSMIVNAAEPPPAAPPKPMGELWEVTSQMSMEGMEMGLPEQTLQVCSPKTWNKPPAPSNEQQKCTTSGFKTDGPKSTWKVVCAGPPAMTGDGEITRSGEDAYAGAIKFASEGGTLTLKLKGRRIGPCDNPAN